MTESLTHAIYSYQGYFKKKSSLEKVNEKYNTYLDNLQYLVNLGILCVSVTYTGINSLSVSSTGVKRNLKAD